MTDLWFGTSGPHDAEIVIVGEAWGSNEEQAKQPFVGQSGQLLNTMLAEAGLSRDQILCTNVVAARPPNNEMWRFFYKGDEAPTDSLYRKLHPTPMVVEEIKRLHLQLSTHPRKVVLATGNYALWATTPFTGAETKGESQGRRAPTGIMSWRGSMTYLHDMWGNPTSTKLIPIVHPAAVMRQWALRSTVVHDLKARVPKALKGDWRRNPAPVMLAPPTFDQARSRLQFWLDKMDRGETVPLNIDIETIRKFNLMTVVGFCDSLNFSMAIPLLRKGLMKGVHDSFWTPQQEATLIRLMLAVASHPNCFVIGQNFLYDTQYFQEWYGVTPKLSFDTMLAWHLLFPGTPKDLGYLSSMLCEYHWYWKDDAKEWDEHGTLEDLLGYNCLDGLRQFECYLSLKDLIPRMGMEAQWAERIENNDLALRMANRGVKIDRERRHRLSLELMDTLNSIYAVLESIIPTSLANDMVQYRKERLGKKITKPSKTPWYTSPDKQKAVFEEMLGMKLPRNHKTKQPTLGYEALVELKQKYPVWTRVFDLIEQARSVAVFRSHFIEAGIEPIPHHGKITWRLRSSFNPGGTETFRWSSSTNAFGRGTNLQNVPRGEEE